MSLNLLLESIDFLDGFFSNHFVESIGTWEKFFCLNQLSKLFNFLLYKNQCFKWAFYIKVTNVDWLFKNILESRFIQQIQKEKFLWTEFRLFIIPDCFLLFMVLKDSSSDGDSLLNELIDFEVVNNEPLIDGFVFLFKDF